MARSAADTSTDASAAVLPGRRLAKAILVLQLIETSRMMVTVKRMELRRKRRQNASKASVGEGDAGSAGAPGPAPAADAAEGKKEQ